MTWLRRYDEMNEEDLPFANKKRRNLAMVVWRTPPAGWDVLNNGWGWCENNNKKKRWFHRRNRIQWRHEEKNTPEPVGRRFVSVIQFVGFRWSEAVIEWRHRPFFLFSFSFSFPLYVFFDVGRSIRDINSAICRPTLVVCWLHLFVFFLAFFFVDFHRSLVAENRSGSFTTKILHQLFWVFFFCVYERVSDSGWTNRHFVETILWLSWFIYRFCGAGWWWFTGLRKWACPFPKPLCSTIFSHSTTSKKKPKKNGKKSRKQNCNCHAGSSRKVPCLSFSKNTLFGLADH